MQMEIKTVIPDEGNHLDFFKRLSDYILGFDPEWIERIKPASEEDIKLLIMLSGIKVQGLELPKYYQIFLEKMGENDGELLTSKEGTSCIKDMIDLYEEIHKFEPETLNPNYLMFYNVNLGSQRALEVGKNENPLVVDFAVGEVCGIRAESFEKLLFQCAFTKYAKSKYTIGFSASGKALKDALIKSNNLDKRVFDSLEDIMNDYSLKKIWIGDEWHYIGFNQKVSFYINHNKLDLGISGYVSGVDESYTVSLAKVLADKLGANMGTVYVKNT